MALSYPCDWKAGFVMDPVKKQRVGYLTAFEGIGLTKPLTPDLTVYSPYPNTLTPTYTGIGSQFEASTSQVKAVGIIENLDWGGGVGDAFSISMYMSSENALQLRALRLMGLTTTSIKQLGFWIVNFDEESKVWFEEAYPKAPAKMTGQVNAVSKNDIRLHIADDPVKVANNIDVSVYNVYIEMVPAANQTCNIHIATSSTKNVVKPWGLVVGTLAAAAVPAGTLAEGRQAR